MTWVAETGIFKACGLDGLEYAEQGKQETDLPASQADRRELTLRVNL